MADIFVITCGVFPNAKYFDGSQWSVNRDEAYEFDTRFDALQAQDYHRLEDGGIFEDIPYS
jgi:hypothetical protein